ncbi:MAG: S9 family peptidase [Acidobacteriota bacterium]|nr:S9 family peptidase [Acidobacteriota bacterium]
MTFGAAQVRAALPELIPREVLLGNPERMQPSLSPDGKLLAYIAPDKKNVLQVWVRTVGLLDDRQLTSEKKRGIEEYLWTYDGEHLAYLQDTDGDENFHLFITSVRTNRTRDLTPYRGIQAQPIGLDPNVPGEILVGINLKDKRRHDAYRIDLKTGAVKFVSANTGNISSWAGDAQLKVRAALATQADGTYTLLAREREGGVWKTLRHWGQGEEGEIIGFSSDGRTLYATGSDNSNAKQLLSFDILTGKETVIASDPEYDVDEVFVHPTKRTIQAVSFNKDRKEWRVLDDQVAADFEAIKGIRRGDFFIENRDLSDKTWLVTYDTDNGPVYYYAYDRETKKAQLLFSHRHELENLPLAEMNPISFQSRDRLTIHGYMTLPVGVEAKNLPTVLYVHGGPWERNKWGFEPLVQWLANRGYAVLQVNFRGSTGYGKNFLNAGDREWAGKMHNDLIDGVNWIIRQGIADPKRVAILGGSYGGYATLVGLTFTPDVFAAGVDICGPSNLATLIKAIPPYWSVEKSVFDKRVGNLETEPEFLHSRSPLFFVDRIKAPLLIGQGANDPRVKQTESEQIVSAMRRAGKAVEYIVYSDEGHGFVRPENLLHFIANAEEFLHKHLGGRLEPVGEIKGNAGVIK